jgi:hypothetical protein
MQSELMAILLLQLFSKSASYACRTEVAGESISCCE